MQISSLKIIFRKATRQLIWLASGSFMCAVVLGVNVSAAELSTQNMTVDQRLKRLEAAMSNQNMVDLFLNMEKLQREIEDLRGEIEILNHGVEQIKKQQKDLYQDLDQRIQQVEMAATAAAENSALVSGGASGGHLELGGTQNAASSNLQLQEQSSYQNAFEFVKQAQYQEAIQAFQAFIQSYPSGDNADNAQYWLGEARYALKDFSGALREFQKVVNAYPKSSKLPDAYLKIGYCQYELKDYAKAQQTLKLVTEKFANSSAARLADKRLQQMRLENKG